MRRTLAAGIALALLTVGSGTGLNARARDAQAAAPAQPTGTAAISGVVTDAHTGRPVAGASVFLYGVGSRFSRPQVLTDARGRFVFVDLPSTHQYSVVATRAGYGAGEYEGPASAVAKAATVLPAEFVFPTSTTVPIRLSDGEWMRDANVRLWRLGAIAGRVVDERGEPIVGAAVRAFTRRMAAGRPLLVPGPVATTDDRGAYRFPVMRPGRYFVAVLSVQATVPATIPDGPRLLPLGGLLSRGRSAPPVARPEAQGASIDVDGRHRLVLTSFATPPPPGADRPRVYPPVFHPNARVIDEAQPVELGIGMSRTDVDFQLTPVAAVRLSGQVTGAVQDAENMILRLMPRGAEHLGFGSEAATTLVEAGGSFTFLNVPAGSYTLVASPAVAEMSSGGSQGNLPPAAGAGPVRGYSAGYPSAVGFSALWWRFAAGASGWGRLPIAVGDSDITSVVLPLQPPATVRGRIVFDDPAQADPNLRFTVMLEPANGDPSLGVPNAVTPGGNMTQEFTIAGLQDGRYLFRISRFRGWFVKSVTVNGVDVTNTGIEGASGKTYDDVVVTITRAGAQLSGLVRDRTGQATRGTVILFPIDPAQWVDYGLTPDRIQSATAGRDGSFRFTTIRDGEYYAIAVPPVQADAWVDPKFLAAAAPHGTKVSLKAGAEITQNLQISEVVVR